MLHHGMAQTCLKKFFSNSRTYCISMSLPQRSGRIFYSMSYISLRMSWGDRTPLSEFLKFIYCIFTLHCKS